MEGCAPPRPLARVKLGPAWSRCDRAGVEPGLEWAMASAEQPIWSFVEGRGGVVGLRAQWGGPTAPASGRTPNASRSRRRRADTEACVPPRPLARVEPGPSPNRYHQAGVKSGPQMGNVVG